MKIYDSHIHSDNSRDAVSSITALCEASAEQGLTGFCVTDHCEINVFDAEDYASLIEQSFFQSRLAKKTFEGSIVIGCGIELGQPAQDTKTADALLSQYDFDFVIGSVHHPRDTPDFAFLDYETADIDLIMNQYFDEILELISWGNFDSLGHLSYPVRYIRESGNTSFDIMDYRPKISQILKKLADSRKALEINTSGLRQAMSETMPSPEIVRMFRELGGEYITVGSDAHSKQDIGRDISAGYDTARKAGFDNVCMYMARQPIPISIVSIVG